MYSGFVICMNMLLNNNIWSLITDKSVKTVYDV